MDVRQFSSDKILGHLDRVEEWLRAGVSPPVTWELDMTNICNHRCPWCFGYYQREDNRQSLKLKEAENIISQIKKFGGRGLTFTGGGEPLCNSHTLEAVEYTRSIGLDIGFITNGTLIDKKSAGIILKNCSWVRISLDAATADSFKFSHGMQKDVFGTVLDNIRILVKQKQRLNSKCTVGIGYLTSGKTKKEIQKFALLCRDLGVDYAQYRPLLSYFGQGGIDYSRKEQKEIVREIEKALKLSQGKIYQVLYSKHKYDNIKNSQIQRPYQKCHGHNFAAVISADKKMYLCCHFRGIEKYCLGDLGKNSLKEIWHSQKRKEVYENIDLSKCPSLCRCDTFNAVLWNIKQEKVHPNFI